MLQKDIRGHTPSAYAALRYGTQSTVFQAMRLLADISQTDINMPLMNTLGRPHQLSVSSSVVQETINTKQADLINAPSQVEVGDWSTIPLQDTHLRGDVNRCDILEVSSDHPIQQ